jgi:transcriptional regulator with XRE-family HTH domain
MSHRIKELIREKGYTQQQFADKLGINRVTLNYHLNGKPSYPTLENIAEALGVEMWELFITREEILAKSPGEITCPYCEKRFSLKS